MSKQLELKLIENSLDSYKKELLLLNDFNIISTNELAEKLKKLFSDKLDKNSKNIIITDEEPSLLLQNYIDYKEAMIIAPIGEKHFINQPLFLISIPKSGTHLLFELVKAFGYREGGICPSNPQGGYWYYTEYSNSHTSAKHFFNDTVYESDFGNRDHPFVTSPALFIYRNPLDIVSSEANYYHKSGKTSFSGYLSALDYDNRLSRLISDKWLLGTIRDRISEFVAWNYFNNVVSLSFEELIGGKGDGDDTIQKQLIWSLQLKLQVPGNPKKFANEIFNKDSDTFFKGQIGSYKELFKSHHYKVFNSLNQDFMEELGYSLESKFSSKRETFLMKKLLYDVSITFPPILKEKQYHEYNIVKYNKLFYGIPIKLGVFDISCEELNSSILVENNIEKVKSKILLSIDT